MPFAAFAANGPSSAPPKVLLVDDDEELTDVLGALFVHHGFQVHSVYSVAEARQAIRQGLPDVAVVDMRLPDGRGEEVIAALRTQQAGQAVPVVVISALADAESVSQARASGADEYLTKPFHPQDLVTVVRNSVVRRREAQKLGTREAHLQTVLLLAKAIEARDAYTGSHVMRVRQYALRLGKALGWPKEQMDTLEFGALMHDLGKIAIPEHILNKPGPLTAEEMRIMRQHPVRGAEMLSGLSYLKAVVPYVLYHHERWDGKGYPYGLKGLEIPVEGRLLAVVDAYDAMTSARPYRRKPLSRAEALAEIRREAGKAFDPHIASVFLKLAAEGKI